MAENSTLKEDPTLSIVNRKINDLIAAEYNPRNLTVKQHDDLRASIQRFGIVDPILVNVHPDRFNIIIGGHMRVKIAKELGLDSVPCVQLNLTPEKEKELNIRLNKNTGEWDWDSLSSFFDTNDLFDFGFTAAELGIEQNFHPEENDDNIPDEVKVQVVTKPGDLFEIVTPSVTIRLCCGDCRNESVLKAVMGDKKAHLVCCDLPYNISYGEDTDHPLWANSRGDRTIANDSMSQEEFEKFLQEALTAIGKVTVPGGMAYYWMSSQEIGTLQYAARKSGWHWSSNIIWAKDRMVMGRKDFHTQYETMWYGWLDGAPRIHPIEDRTHTDLWEHPRPSKSEAHPNQKPVVLITKQIGLSSNAGENVIDFFCGSGTTCVACLKTGRNGFFTECEPRYCDVILRRLHDFMDENAISYTARRNGEPFIIPEVYQATEEVPVSKEAANN